MTVPPPGAEMIKSFRYFRRRSGNSAKLLGNSKRAIHFLNFVDKYLEPLLTMVVLHRMLLAACCRCFTARRDIAGRATGIATAVPFFDQYGSERRLRLSISTSPFRSSPHRSATLQLTPFRSDEWASFTIGRFPKEERPL